MRQGDLKSTLALRDERERFEEEGTIPPEIGGRKSEGGDRRSEVGSRKSEIGDRKSEVGDRADVGRRRMYRPLTADL